ncbi:MAG: hypothetical protein JXA62_06875 [Candidatus Aminicenantes bacterium]|nr:hypothetical protein [Candidatus Aminicenantes bacterium]
MKNEVVIEFSGGIDSLYAAHYLAGQYDRVHLLTFDKGYLHILLKANQPNIELLQSLHGKDKITHQVMDIRHLFKEMAVRDYKETSKEFGKEAAWCMPCRASMALASVIYALDHDIPVFTDGANWEQAPDGKKILVTGDNFPEFLSMIKDFASRFHVEYLPVVYDLNTREDRRRELQRLGAKIDFNSMNRTGKSPLDVFNPKFYSRVQPMCLSGYLVHWKRNLLKVPEEVTPEIITAALQPKLDTIAERLVREHLENRGINVAELVSRRKAEKG